MAKRAVMELVIELQDNASKGLEGLAAKLTGVGQAGGLLAGIGKKALLGGIAAAGAGIAGLTAGLVSSIGAASEAEGIAAQLEAVLASTGGAAGMTADSVNDLALSLSKVTRFEDDTIVSGQNLLLTFTNIGKDVFPLATEAMLNMSTALGQDLKSSATQLGKALQDPIRGVTALRRVGVALTDAQLDQIRVLQESGDIMGAQKIILAELEKEFGGAARAAGQTAAGQLDIFNNAIGNIKEEIGGALMPVLTELMTKFGPMLTSALQTGASFIIGTLIPKLSTLAQWLGEKIPLAITWVSQHFETIKGIILGVGTALATGGVISWILAFVAAIGSIGTAVTASGSILGGLVALLGGPVTVAVAGIALAVGALAAAWATNFGGIRDKATAVWDAIQPVFQAIATWLQTNIPLAIQALVGFWNGTLLPAFQAAWNWISTYLVPVFQAIANVVSAVLQKAFEALVIIFTTVVMPALRTLWAYFQESILPVLQDIADKINTVLGPAFEWLRENVLSKVLEVFTWIGDKVSAVTGFLNDLAGKIRSFDLGKLGDILGLGGNATAGSGGGGNNMQATGSHFYRGGATWVGERGPELVLPPRGSRILSTGEAQRLGGGGTTNNISVNLTLPAGTAADTQAAAKRGAEAGVMAAMRQRGLVAG